jgi:hypothetical protein
MSDRTYNLDGGFKSSPTSRHKPRATQETTSLPVRNNVMWGAISARSEAEPTRGNSGSEAIVSYLNGGLTRLALSRRHFGYS